MPHVVTQSCCSDASCVYACPVNCIHPSPDEPDFLSAEMLHIDPTSCVDCGACVSACPVDAIVPHTKLDVSQQEYLSINADFYTDQRQRPLLAPIVHASGVNRERGPLRVAIVGSGPSAMYAADELLTQPDVQVDVFDRLPAPYGLVRAGVSPDHQKTKQVTRLFDTIAGQQGFAWYLNVEVGKHVSHGELLEHHHAVIYAVGASADRKLDVPGADLPGTASATDFVAWYNGHPDHAGRTFDLSHRRAVIVGNGNVALDVARILMADPERLASTDISQHALAALRDSKVEEVVIVGRRGPAESAFTVPEFVGLLGAPDIDIVVEGDLDSAEYSVGKVQEKLRLLRVAQDRKVKGGKRIVFKYLASPTEILGEDRVIGVELGTNSLEAGVDGGVRAVPTGEREQLGAGLVLTSIGYRGVPVNGLPFDEAAGVVPNAEGRVDGRPGSYVTGWIKRGPTGFIGTNKSCAQETVRALVADFNSGTLPDPRRRAAGLKSLVRERRPEMIDRAGWHTIDEAERLRGMEQNRVRDKITDLDEIADLMRAIPRRRLTLSVVGRR